VASFTTPATEEPTLAELAKWDKPRKRAHQFFNIYGITVKKEISRLQKHHPLYDIRKQEQIQLISPRNGRNYCYDMIFFAGDIPIKGIYCRHSSTSVLPNTVILKHK
jgi:hypothetical protein